MAENSGNNSSNQGLTSTVAQLEAEAKAADAGEAEFWRSQNGENAQAQTQDVNTTNPDASQDVQKNVVPQQFRNENGTLNDEKLAKSTENLEKAFKSKQEALEYYRQLQRKFTQVSKELKIGTEETSSQNVSLPAGQQTSTGFEEDLMKEAENKLGVTPDVARTLASWTQRIAQKELEAFRREHEQHRLSVLEEQRLGRMEELAKENPWLRTEDGMRVMAQVFDEHPELWGGRDPYGTALRLLGNPILKGQTPAAAQGGLRTPILGASGAVPPVSNQPTVSRESELNRLMKEYDFYRTRNPKRADEAFLKWEKLQAENLAEQGLPLY